LKRFVLAALAAVSLAGARARADTVTLVAIADGTLYAQDGATADGGGQHLFAGRTDDGVIRRAVLRFDVAAGIPPGATISAATLRLYMSRTKTADVTVSLHRVLASWTEGTTLGAGEEGAGGPVAGADVTWTLRSFPALAWATAGGDFAATASASMTVTRSFGTYSWSSATLAADVQAWLSNPATNYGWMIVGNETGTRVTKRFDSRQNPDTTHRPTLEVTFTPPAVATGACCSADGTCGVVLDPGTSCAGRYRGAGTSCSTNPCPQRTAACCLQGPNPACLATTAADCSTRGGTFRSADASCTPDTCPISLTPFVDALPRPPVAQPLSGLPGAAASYRLAIVEISQQLHRDLPPTRVWGFDDGVTGGTYPGPTIEASRGEAVSVTWVNDLRDASGALRTAHYLPVDACPHGADSPTARTVIHLHGGHVPAASDGYPEATFLPGQQAVYDYPNQQLPATLWYHDHSLGITRLNVYMGMAGVYLLRSAEEQELGLPSGEYEVPLVIQDRSFRADGSLRYPAELDDMFLGDVILVNGKVWPFLDVKRGKYRLRLLNGSNTRTYTLALSSGDPFQQIGSDGGLLDAPVSQTSLTIAPGERVDVVVDFAGYNANTKIMLTNSAPAPYPNDPGVGVVADVMQFVVTNEVGFTASVPATLSPMQAIDPAQAAETRDFVLDRVPATCGMSDWRINGLGWMDVTERPVLGTTEIWRFTNASGSMHPMHLHLVMFQVLDRQPFELVNGIASPMGPAVPASGGERGFKDTVMVGAHEIVRVIARFEDYAGKFAYHCHILEHEDHEMMRQFETVSGAAGAGAMDGGVPDGGVTDGGATGGGAGANGVGGAAAGDAGDDGGCGCETPRSAPSRGYAVLLCAGAAVGVRRRRRRGTPPPSFAI
jgi:spore coat protein A